MLMSLCKRKSEEHTMGVRAPGGMRDSETSDEALAAKCVQN